jgi:hypothetical protein
VAQVLLEAVPPFTTAGNAWKASAELAWDWAEAIYQGWLAGGRTNATVDGYFNGVLGIQSIGVTSTGAFMSDNTVWNSMLTSMFNTGLPPNRLMAAGVLYNLTNNNTKYGTIIAAQSGLGAAPNQAGMGLWDFSNCSDAQTRYPTQVADLNSRWANTNVNKNSNFDMLVKPAIKGAQNQDNQHMKWLLERLNYSHGVNQEDMTAVSALGYRSPQNCSIRDREAMGLTSDFVPGTRMYWHFAGQHAYGGAASYSSDSALNYTVIYPTTSAIDPMWETRVITPFPVMHPYEECFNDNTYAAFHTEYIAVYSMEYFNIAMIAHCFDGNDVTTTPDASKRYKRRLSCAP